jgi:uncharacterized protein YbaP (TraB family)
MVVRKDSVWLSAAVQGAFDACTEFWTENPDPAAGPPPASPAASGPRLIEATTPDEMARLRRLLEQAGLKSNALDDALLSDAYSAVSFLHDQGLGADFESIPERVLRSRAKQAGKVIRSEWASFAAVADFRASLSPAMRAALDLQLFRRGLLEAENPQAARRRLDEWQRGDMQALNDMDVLYRREYPLLMRLIGDERNRAWVARANDIARRTDAAFACQGIGHLLGPRSIQACLQEAGWDVSRVA